MSLLWEIEVFSINYIWADTEEEARSKYNQTPCADSADFIKSIKQIQEHEAHFELECRSPETTEVNRKAFQNLGDTQT